MDGIGERQNSSGSVARTDVDYISYAERYPANTDHLGAADFSFAGLLRR